MVIRSSLMRLARCVRPVQVAPVRSKRTITATPSAAPPAPTLSAVQKVGSGAWPATSLLIHLLFSLVALLLVADLHSSYLAGSAKWETNPFMTVLAESVGSRAALLGVKAVDFICLFGMYALWRRSKAHVVIALALVTAAFVYVEIVLNNYSS